MAICEITRVRWKEKRSRPDVVPRLPDFSATVGVVREDRSAGTRSKSAHVAKATVPVKAKARQSRPKSSRSVLSCARSNHTIVRLNA